MESFMSVQHGSTSPLDALRGAWDVLVIGAGVCGASAALAIARASPTLRVALVERAAWPRDKVCGCCLNAAACRLLESLGVSQAMTRAGASALQGTRIWRGARSVELPSAGGLVLGRRELDTLLVDAAERAGVTFVSRASAHVLEPSDEHAHHRVEITQDAGRVTCEAKLVIVADGLQGSALRSVSLPASTLSRIAHRSWMGVGAVMPEQLASALSLPIGQVQLFIARGGYVGIVRAGDDQAHLAAALDPVRVRALVGPGPLVCAILAASDLSLDSKALSLRGTPLLTRARPRPALPGLIIAGDAAGFVEPFTGEGMAWSLASGCALGSLVHEAHAHLHAGASWAAGASDAWVAWHARKLRPRMRVCRAVRRAAHHPWSASAAIAVLKLRGLGACCVSRLHAAMARPYSESTPSTSVHP
jgi:menaquinone-9 beta-reductase